MTEWLASEYHQHSSLQQAMADESLAALTLEGSERVLDIGCGDGKITAEIATRVPRGSVLGVDPSRAMVEFASKRFCLPAYSNLVFAVDDARRLVARGLFDLVVSFNALHWVADQPAALSAIRSVLQPRGRAMLRFVCKGPRESLEEVIEEVRRRPAWAGAFADFHQPHAHFTPEAYRGMADAAGFHIVELDARDKAWDFQTREAFVAFARATFVEWTRRLPESQWLPFISEVLDRYQLTAATDASEINTFKFYQLHVVLTPAG